MVERFQWRKYDKNDVDGEQIVVYEPESALSTWVPTHALPPLPIFFSLTKSQLDKNYFYLIILIEYGLGMGIEFSVQWHSSLSKSLGFNDHSFTLMEIRVWWHIKDNNGKSVWSFVFLYGKVLTLCSRMEGKRKVIRGGNTLLIR